jgi:hypothetical protein
MNRQISSTRKIFRTKSTGNSEVRELLEAILVSELIMPSPVLWLVSPWITDLEILDNRSAAYSALVPMWGLRRIRISEILASILDRTKVFIVARPDPHNNAFLSKMEDMANASKLSLNLVVLRQETLHLKGLLGRDYYLSGSMNLTYNGVEINDEGIVFERSPDAISLARIHFQENYGATSQ